MRTRTYILLTQSALLVLLLAIGLLVFVGIQRNAVDTRHAEQTRQTLTQIERVLTSVVDLETGLRGYLLNHDARFLEPYTSARRRFPRELEALRRLEITLNDAQVDEHLTTVRSVERLVRGWEENFARRALALREQDQERMIAFTRTGAGKKIIDEVRQLFHEYQQDETAELAARRSDAARSLREVQALTVVGILVAIVAAVMAALRVSTRLSRVFGSLTRSTRKLADGDLQERVAPQFLDEANDLARDFNRMADQLQAAQTALQENVEQLTRAYQEMQVLGELTDHLQICGTLDEGYELLGRLLPATLPGTSGSVAIMNPSRTLVEVAVRWGQPRGAGCEDTFTPDSCWAIRRGRTYDPRGQHLGVSCSLASSLGSHLCLPLHSQGEMLGLLRLGLPGELPEGTREFAERIASQVALALGNLRLRDHLNNLSVRDPLTGLYNRRYLEETVDREIHRSDRHQHPTSLLMFDVDHFKRFNDLHGHAAGDAVLVELSRLLRFFFRKEDVPCRYGGEEFLVLLPHADVDQARQRAEELRRQINQMSVQHQGRTLERVSISVGVASFGEHGQTMTAVTEAADAALYQAKREGRNRVVTAEVVASRS